MDSRAQDYQDSVFFARSSELSIRMITCLLDGSPATPSMLPVDWCSPSFHRHDYINQKARTLFLSPFPSLLFFSFPWKAPRGKVTWIRVIESADDRRENVLNTEQDEHSIVVFDEKGESGPSTCCTIPLAIEETRLSFSPFLFPPPLCIPRRLFSAYYSERVQGVPASDSLVVEACNFVYIYIGNTWALETFRLD